MKADFRKQEARVAFLTLLIQFLVEAKGNHTKHEAGPSVVSEILKCAFDIVQFVLMPPSSQQKSSLKIEAVHVCSSEMFVPT